ncbi:hypothetical protein RQP46_002745 [Phenoliferia psychrophenolica]
MSDNPPGARLSFPNEVLDKIFDHLVQSLPTTPMDSESNKSIALEALAVASLVSHQWRGVALRRMVAKLVVRTGSRAREVTRMLETPGLAGMVKELRFEGGGGGTFGLKTAPTSSEASKRNWLTPDVVVAFLHLTRRLRVLKLHRLPFFRIRKRDLRAIAALPIIHTVETLHFASASLDVHQELMASLIPLFPAVRELLISPAYDGKKTRTAAPRTNLPNLETLFLSGATSISTFLAVVDPSPGTLKRLDVASPDRTELEALLSQVGPSLDEFGCSSQSLLSTYFSAVPSRCPNITIVDVFLLWSVFDAFTLLTQLPATVHTLRLTHMELPDNVGNLLEALSVTPKPPGLLVLEVKKDRTDEIVPEEKLSKFEAYGLRAVRRMD